VNRGCNHSADHGSSNRLHYVRTDTTCPEDRYPENFAPKTGISALQSVRFRFAVHSTLGGERRAILWLEVVTVRSRDRRMG